MPQPWGGEWGGATILVRGGEWGGATILLYSSNLRIQESAGDERREAGRIPRTIECELTADLVDSCVPGDMVTVAAVVKATGSDEGGGGGGGRSVYDGDRSVYGGG